MALLRISRIVTDWTKSPEDSVILQKCQTPFWVGKGNGPSLLGHNWLEMGSYSRHLGLFVTKILKIWITDKLRLLAYIICSTHAFLLPLQITFTCM